jgi:hypothetical protein
MLETFFQAFHSVSSRGMPEYATMMKKDPLNPRAVRAGIPWVYWEG